MIENSFIRVLKTQIASFHERNRSTYFVLHLPSILLVLSRSSRSIPCLLYTINTDIKQSEHWTKRNFARNKKHTRCSWAVCKLVFHNISDLNRKWLFDTVLSCSGSILIFFSALELVLRLLVAPLLRADTFFLFHTNGNLFQM